MDSNSVVVIIALLCFFFFFFFFFLLGGFYFFLVKKNDTSEKSDTKLLYYPFVPPIVSPLLKQSAPVDISEGNNNFDNRLESVEKSLETLIKIITEYNNFDNRLESVEKFLGSSYENRNNVDFVRNYGRPENFNDNNYYISIQEKISELQETVSVLKQEKELREKNALEERIAQEEKERIKKEEAYQVRVNMRIHGDIPRVPLS